MLRRSIWEFSSRGSFRRSTTRITTQIPSYLSSRKQYSVASDQNAPQGSGSAGKPPDSGSSLPKIIMGGTALAAAVFAAYHLNQQLEEQRKVLQSAKVGPKDSADLSRNYKGPLEDKSLGPQSVMSSTQEKDDHRPDIPAQETIETHSDFPNLDDLNKEEEIQIQVKDKTELTPEEDIMPAQQREVPSSTQSSITSNDESITSRKSLEGKMDLKSTEVKPITEQHEAMEITPIHAVPNENEMNSTSSRQQTATDLTEDTICIRVEQPNSLLDEYYIRNKTEATTPTSSDKHEDGIDAIEDSGDAFISKDGKLVLDFLQAIHAAEKRQAELDAHIFAEEKRKLKEKCDKELKDARARELMYAEEAAILDKELNKERVKTAAALKSLQEELEEKLRMELEQKEAEAEIKMKAIQELAKAELVAELASEKSSHIEKMAEADLHINALCMAFYARSEEARQSHSIHKLALGALALEDALSKGLPIKKEIDALHRYLEVVDKDPLLDLVLSSLPQDTRDNGSDTILKLKHEFDALKGTLRHFSLIPPGGGGILAHSLAHVASLLKVKESNESGDGIESLMNKVESFLAEGKLSEAADTLENGVKGTQAAEVIGDWLRRARNRAVTEQVLTLLQAYATSIGLT